MKKLKAKYISEYFNNYKVLDTPGVYIFTYE